MNEIKNDQKVAQLNSQMQTDYLRKIDFKNKKGESRTKLFYNSPYLFF
jgi:hypothetical protein